MYKLTNYEEVVSSKSYNDLILTDEQRQLVHDNEKLIWHMMIKHDLSCNAVIDWYGVCAVSLCISAIKFDPELSKFSTFACYNMLNAIRMMWRWEKIRFNSSNTYSIDVEIANKNGTEYTLKDTMETPAEDINELFDAGELQKALMCIYDRMEHEHHRDMIRLRWFDGLKQDEVAMIVGYSKGYVSKITNKYKHDVYKYLGIEIVKELQK